MEEVVVTAQRREQVLTEVPQAVQAMSGDALTRTGITDIQAAMALIPSASTSSTIGVGSSTYQIRGIAASETDGDPSVGYYLDNFPFSMPGRPYAPGTDFYDLQRVEVLRGPSGTLYGLGSLGGTIKVLTNDPDLDAFAMSARVTGNETSGGDPGWSGNLMVNAPLVPGTVALRGVVSVSKIGGYADVLPSNEKNGNSAKLFNARLKLLAEPTEELSVKLSYWKNKSRQDFSNRITFIDPPRLDQTFGEADSDYDLGALDIEYDLGFATLLSSTGYIKNTVISNNGGFIPPPIGNFVSLWPLETKSFNQDFRITSTSDGALRYLAGVFYQDGRTAGGQTVQLPDFVLAPGVVGFSTVNDGNEISSESWAVYGEVTYTMMDERLDLTVGGRYYEERRQFDEDSQLDIAGQIIPNVSRTKAKNNTFNPRFNIAWHVSDAGMLYAEAAKGFRSGAITSASIIGASNAVLGTDLSNSSPPDTLWNYEAGVKWQLFERTLSVSFNGYYVDWEDAQIELSPALQSIVAPVGDVRGRGLELDLTWATPLDGLTLQFVGNTSKTTIKNIPAEITAGIPHLSNGTQLPGTVKQTYTVSGRYERDLPGTDLLLRTNARHSHRSRQQSIFDGAFAPSFGLSSVQASVGKEAWEVGLFVNNLTNTDGPLSRPGGQFQIPYPRTFGISLDVYY